MSRRRMSPAVVPPATVSPVTGEIPQITGRHQRRHMALVTGATSGLGLAIAQNLALDHDLVLMARNASHLDELAAVLSEENGTRVRTCAVDLTDDEAVAKAVGDLRLRSLDILVHSAGVESSAPIASLTPAQWREVLDLDLVAVAHLTSLVLPALRATRGLVVMINSSAGLRTWAGHTLYSAAKAGLKALADGLREEERGVVRVTSIFPGSVDTPMQHRVQAARGGEYRAEDHMAPSSVAAAVRLAADPPLDAVVENLALRPPALLGRAGGGARAAVSSPRGSPGRARPRTGRSRPHWPG